MTKIEGNKAELWKDIWELANTPLNAARAANLVKNLEVYDALCRVACIGRNGGVLAAAEVEGAPHLDRRMAEKWVSRMENRDGTTGPHFSWAKAQEIMQQHGIDYDPVKFWVALNTTYSDMCAFFKKYNINTIDAYVDHTLDFWFRDQDAVEDKLAAYYSYVVKH